MPSDTPITPDSSLPSHQPAGYNSGEHALDAIARQLRLLSARMDRAEDRLGIAIQPPGAVREGTESAERAAPATPTLSPARSVPAPPPAPLPDPLSRVKVSIPPAAMPPVTPQPGLIPAPIPTPIATPASSESVSSTGSFVDSTKAKPAWSTPGGAREKKLLGDWENLIGGKWALWVGLLSLFLAVAYFLAYTWKSAETIKTPYFLP